MVLCWTSCDSISIYSTLLQVLYLAWYSEEPIHLTLSKVSNSFVLSMPICSCEAHACNFKELAPRNFENHRREDERRNKMRNVRQAYALATQACDKQNNDIAAYISSLTLSDNATGSTPASGGRLWSRSAQDSDISTHLSLLMLSDDAVESNASTDAPRKTLHPQASPHYSPIRDALSELNSLEQELSSLISVAGPQLKNLTAPSSRDNPFPLKSAISAARLLRDRLYSITNQSSAVREAKATTTDRLSAFLEELMDGNASWNKHLKRLPEIEGATPTYETSERNRPLFLIKATK